MADKFEVGKTYVWDKPGASPFVVLGRGVKDPSKVYVEYLKGGSMEVHWDDQFKQFREYVIPRTKDVYCALFENVNGSPFKTTFNSADEMTKWLNTVGDEYKIIGSKKVTLTEGEFITDG